MATSFSLLCLVFCLKIQLDCQKKESKSYLQAMKTSMRNLCNTPNLKILTLGRNSAWYFQLRNAFFSSLDCTFFSRLDANRRTTVTCFQFRKQDSRLSKADCASLLCLQFSDFSIFRWYVFIYSCQEDQALTFNLGHRLTNESDLTDDLSSVTA